MKKIILIITSVLALLGCSNDQIVQDEVNNNTDTSSSRIVDNNDYMDFDGNGCRDYIEIGRHTRSTVKLGLRGGGFYSYFLDTGSFHGHQGNKYRHYIADTNGDGKDDLIQTGDRLTWISFTDKVGIFKLWNHTVNTGHFKDGHSFKYDHIFGDVNGDGRDDMIQIGDRLIWVGLADTSGKFKIWSHTVNTGHHGHIYGHFIADVNGDGRDDLIQRGDRLMWIGLADTSGKFNIWTHTVNTGRYGGKYDHDFYDINGDGRADMIQTDSYNNRWVGLADINGKFKIWSY